MKIERLIGILSILLQKNMVTAPYLAKHFEVSRRTINRDIEDLCKAGIPIYTKQGQGGGISIMEEYKNSLVPKIEVIRNAIDTSEELEFLYFSQKGEDRRTIEPYFLIFRWSSWYVWGWCKKSCDYRLFKLNRMEQVSLNGNRIEKRSVPLPNLSNERIFPGGISVKALFEPECKWRLVVLK